MLHPIGVHQPVATQEMPLLKIVAMGTIQGRMDRDGRDRSDLSYAPYGIATWKWWCHHNGAEFVLLSKRPGGPQFANVAPSVTRWLAPEELLEGRADARVAVVDADTMVRWDTPDFFGAAEDPVAAVRDISPDWIYRSIKAHQRLFPTTKLPWWEYFNSGLVVLSTRHLPALRVFADLYRYRHAEVQQVQADSSVGYDQTPLNLAFRSCGQPVRFLDAPFNAIRCFPLSYDLMHKFEFSSTPDWTRFEEVAFARAGTFDFVEHSYVWHFCNIVKSRARIMRETWRRVRQQYPGLGAADLPECAD
jgi:hypothetical protein